MRIIQSQVNKPEDVIAKSIRLLGEQTTQALENLTLLKDGTGKELEALSKTLTNVESKVERIEQTDYSIDTDSIINPISEQLESLKDGINKYRQAVSEIEVKPNVNVSVDPPDLEAINESFSELDKRINELFRELDLMERPELKDYLKKILDLLDKINKKTWVIVGGGGGQSILQGYEINTGNLVNITAVESADMPGIYGVLALNSDGSAIGSGGGVPVTYDRITSDGDIRITSDGDIRVFAT